ncbi:F-box protein At5g52880 [Punica granatum]|uniref:F-box protein At5g52880 n=2 Tax=Punica granatum TaxID=22663 RepID=A0A6P8CCY4_PUNGR|nr:F-box protein At5g52880 [Punica granatum]PKI52098.1 hypothetical protein CRG98_027514 [Punica granatum]
MASLLERYQKLGIGESLPRIHRYPIACKELSFILRGAYKKFPKNVQSLIFQDTLAAFRLLPRMQTQTAVSASNLLAQAAEVALPKQKKSLAAKEFKHAKIAQKRQSKVQQEGKDCAQLPQDVLMHIMSFLDFQSLVSVGVICWSWNLAAGDDSLWKAQYTKIFGHQDASLKTENSCNETARRAHRRAMLDEISDKSFINWREAFKKAYTGKSSRRLISNRGYCRHCKTIVWLRCTVCSSQHPEHRSGISQIKPVQPHQVVNYLLDEFSSSDSESDSDTEGHPVSRLWAYSKATHHRS